MHNRIILVSHLGLATGMKKALEFIVGQQPQISAVELDERGIEQFKENLRALQSEQNTGTTIIVSDIPAGSPGATAYSIFSEIGETRLLSGMNLPLILDLVLSGPTKPLEKLIPEAIDSAKETIQEYTIESISEVDDDF
ncbi:PTS sugar transporter subunit IIA [Enterococcus crotali]|uniref:PTS sugar transporter subunit IIA n=1 Tax=Enterococcus crotali TaxID=1453587 RepID=UPI00046EF4EA|nr:hypothetical protein [Enterococcus crotali]